MSLRRRRRNRDEMFPEVSLTPLIDTALTLLIIFMVTTPMIQHSIKVNLPEAKVKPEKASSKQQLVVYIDEKEKVYFNGKEVSLDNLAKQVEQGLKTSQDKVIVIKGDKAKTLSYSKIVEVLDVVNSVEGEKYVALAAKRSL